MTTSMESVINLAASLDTKLNPDTGNMSAPTSITISLTRANKILAKLRQLASSDYNPGRTSRRRYLPEQTKNIQYGLKVKLLTFNEANTVNKIAEIRSVVNNKITLKNLIERWKNILFALNVKYTLHDILSELDCLNNERSVLIEILNESKDSEYRSLSDIMLSMEATKTSEKRYDFEWYVAAFDSDEIKKRVASIDKQIAALDDKKDRLNIENSFTISLSAEEMALVGL